MARKKKLPPWGDLGDGRPIERLFSKELCSAERRFDELAEKDARSEQFKRMCRLKEHYGIQGESGWRPWYELALALASERDPALTIVDKRPPPTGKTAARWRGPEGLQLCTQIELMKREYEEAGKPVPTILALLAQHQQEYLRYSEMKLEDLDKAYYAARAHWGPKLGYK